MRSGDDEVGAILRGTQQPSDRGVTLGASNRSEVTRNIGHHEQQHENGVCDCSSRKSGVSKYIMIAVLIIFCSSAVYFIVQIMRISQSQSPPLQKQDGQTENRPKGTSQKTFIDGNKHRVTILKKYKRHTLSKTAGLAILPGRIIVECTQDYTTSGVFVVSINEDFSEIESLVGAGSLESYEDGRGCFAAATKSDSKLPYLYHLEASTSKLYKTKIISQHRYPALLPTEERQLLVLPPEIKHPVCGCASDPSSSQNKAFIFHDTDGYSTLTEIDLIPKKSKLTSLRHMSQFMDSNNTPRRLKITAVAWLGNFLLLATATDHVLHLLNPQNMKLVDTIDLSVVFSDLLEDERQQSADSLDARVIGRSTHFTGLAVDPSTGDIYITGNRWVSLFRLRVLGFGV